MPDMKISEMTPLGAAPATGDMLEIVDISEPTVEDRSKSITFADIFNSPTIDTPELMTPVIASMVSAQHKHMTSAGGGALDIVCYENSIVCYENEIVQIS